MKLPLILVATLPVLSVIGTRDRYTVVQENITIGFRDDKYTDTAAEIYKFNETSFVLNFTCLLKIELPNRSKVSITGFKWLKTDYRLPIVRLDRTLKEIMEMDLFDVQDLFLKYCSPPAIWPLQKNVSYHVMGWNPDSSKFPPNFPQGKWKFQITSLFPNGAKFLEINWFFRIQY